MEVDSGMKRDNNKQKVIGIDRRMENKCSKAHFATNANSNVLHEGEIWLGFEAIQWIAKKDGLPLLVGTNIDECQVLRMPKMEVIEYTIAEWTYPLLQ